MSPNKLSVLLEAAVLSASITAPASASEVNTYLSENPSAALAEIEAMHPTPLSDAEAMEIRGEPLGTPPTDKVIDLFMYNPTL